jgi:hypothetical protein
LVLIRKVSSPKGGDYRSNTPYFPVDTVTYRGNILTDANGKTTIASLWQPFFFYIQAHHFLNFLDYESSRKTHSFLSWPFKLFAYYSLLQAGGKGTGDALNFFGDQ